MALKNVAVLLLVLFSACSEEVLHEIDEVKANRILVTLAEKGVQAHKSRDAKGWTVSVDTDQYEQALAVLEKSRIVRSLKTAMPEPSGGLLQSREERRHVLSRSMARDIEKTLERLPNVLEARVHIHHTRRRMDPVSRTSSRESASVLLIVSDETKNDLLRVQKLVSGASGITINSVAVVMAAVEDATRTKDSQIERGSLTNNWQEELPLRSEPANFTTTLLPDFAVLRNNSVRYMLAALVVLIPLLLVRRHFTQRRQRSNVVKAPRKSSTRVVLKPPQSRESRANEG